MKVLIIEDESPAARRLQKRIEEIEPAAEITAVIDSVKDSVAWLDSHAEPDIIFCDIELSDGLSFEIFSQVEVHAPVIFTTAYDEYALRAFRVNSVDYLLKPVDAAGLKRAFDKWRLHHAAAQKLNGAANGSSSGSGAGAENESRTQAAESSNADATTDAAVNASKSVSKTVSETAGTTPGAVESAAAENLKLSERLDQIMRSIQAPTREFKQRFLVKTGLNWISLHVDQIAWFTTEDKVVLLIDFDNNRHPLSHSLDELDAMLDPRHFFRANRQYIVAYTAVQSAQSYFNGKLKLRVQPPVEDGVIVSRDRAAAFKEWLDR